MNTLGSARKNQDLDNPSAVFPYGTFGPKRLTIVTNMLDRIVKICDTPAYAFLHDWQVERAEFER